MFRILLVDNNLLLRNLLIDLLKNRDNINVVGSLKSGLDVIPFLLENTVDIVLMDINIGAQNGIRVMEKVKEEFSHLKVILYSYNDFYTYDSVVNHSGADGFILKFDLTIESLLMEFEKVMGNKL